jgi:hypothetical protein
MQRLVEVKVNRRFGGTRRLHLQGRKGRKQSCLLHALCWFLPWLTLRPWGRKRHVSPKRRLTFTGLHGVISQKIELFLTTAVRISGPTYDIHDSCKKWPRERHAQVISHIGMCEVHKY